LSTLGLGLLAKAALGVATDLAAAVDFEDDSVDFEDAFNLPEAVDFEEAIFGWTAADLADLVSLLDRELPASLVGMARAGIDFLPLAARFGAALGATPEAAEVRLEERLAKLEWDLALFLPPSVRGETTLVLPEPDRFEPPDLAVADTFTSLAAEPDFLVAALGEDAFAGEAFADPPDERAEEILLVPPLPGFDWGLSFGTR
jgi:hypothetical protein